MSEDDSGDKLHEPSQKKLEDARRKGDIPRSADLNTAAGYGGLILVGAALGAASLSDAGELLSIILDQSEAFSKTMFSDSGQPLFGGIIGQVFKIFGPWFVAPAALTLLAIIAQKSLVFAPDKLAPKLSKISPLANAKKKFGRSGMFEFLKSFAKLAIYSVILGLYLSSQMPRILLAIHLSSGQITTELLSLTLGLLVIVLVVAVALGAVDFLWQQAEHIRKNRMSRKEVTDEMKQSEGDPAMKQQRRQKAITIAMNQMLADVPGADVIIVNPSHYAVALEWDRAGGGAPVCVAKGADEVARRIRQIAIENSVPIHSDPPTARALFATVDIGFEIKLNHFRAVAAAIRFAERIRNEVKVRHK